MIKSKELPRNAQMLGIAVVWLDKVWCMMVTGPPLTVLMGLCLWGFLFYKRKKINKNLKKIK